jgi:hypothetical protein
MLRRISAEIPMMALRANLMALVQIMVAPALSFGVFEGLRVDGDRRDINDISWC